MRRILEHGKIEEWKQDPPAAFTVGAGQQRVPVWDETLELVGVVLMLRAETDEFQMVFSESAARIQSDKSGLKQKLCLQLVWLTNSELFKWDH